MDRPKDCIAQKRFQLAVAAIKEGRKEGLEALFFDCQSDEAKTELLLTAIEKHQHEILDYLLSLGADPNGRVKDRGKTPLIMACSCVTCTRILINHNADPNVIVDRTIPILQAISRGKLEVVRLLLDAGSQVIFGSHNMLYYAAKSNKPEICGEFMRMGVVDSRNANGLTAVQQAVNERYFECALICSTTPPLRHFSGMDFVAEVNACIDREISEVLTGDLSVTHVAAIKRVHKRIWMFEQMMDKWVEDAEKKVVAEIESEPDMKWAALEYLASWNGRIPSSLEKARNGSRSRRNEMGRIVLSHKGLTALKRWTEVVEVDVRKIVTDVIASDDRMDKSNIGALIDDLYVLRAIQLTGCQRGFNFRRWVRSLDSTDRDALRELKEEIKQACQGGTSGINL